MDKIPIGVSSCLIGEKVRWNGDHKQDRYVKDILGRFFEWVPVCPEVEVGMGVPRETVALYGSPDQPSMIGKKTGEDWTLRMNRYAKNKIHELEAFDLCGYIFKSKSPSCGLDRIPVYFEKGSSQVRHRHGLFADAFAKRFPIIPIEDEGRLNDSRIRENFIVRVFGFHRLQGLFNREANKGTLVRFHTQNKFLLLAHSRKHYQSLGKIVAETKGKKWSDIRHEYIAIFMEALTYKSTAKKNADVLMHMMGFFKKLLPREDKQNILATIEDYRKELIPLIVPVTLIRHFVNKFQVDYLMDQVYLNPHPKELMLRNHV